MDFAIPAAIAEDLARFKDFIKAYIIPSLPSWNRQRGLPPAFFHHMGEGGWFSLNFKDGRLTRESALKEVLVAEALAAVSPGVAIAALAHIDLGLMGMFLFGSQDHHRTYGPDAVRGKTVMCLGNTENIAGSDVAGISMTAEKIDGGWVLNGTKAYVTNGYIADLGVITAVSDPDAARNSRLSMYLVDLNTEGVSRKKLNKQVWIPSDLTRLKLDNVFVPDDHLLGIRGRGLQQVLEIFTNSRVPISALTLGGAVGAFNLAVNHMQKRKIFGKKIINYQAKAFEISDYYAKIESARLMLWKACWDFDQADDFRQAASMAKYLAVEIARQVTVWAADIFGAASVVHEHPIHKYPMDTWGASLGEGTQDVQKLIIFREFMKRWRVNADRLPHQTKSRLVPDP
ncbi:Butyryl-CoA dehydrogenase (EC [Olavius sp. associated proteobacterium Delta 1]|nr:Butyryl-CoA dehydrogenase (EC [Olavius sp. associated proteobacterium Delta 1]